MRQSAGRDPGRRGRARSGIGENSRSRKKGGCLKDSIRDEIKDLKRQTQAQVEEAHSHVVRSCDSLSEIAEELLGDADRGREIFETNRDEIDHPNEIRAGQELQIPSR